MLIGPGTGLEELNAMLLCKLQCIIYREMIQYIMIDPYIMLQYIMPHHVALPAAVHTGYIHIMLHTIHTCT